MRLAIESQSITVAGHRKILDGVWQPAIGHRNFLHVTYSELVSIADSHVWSRKTYNNAISSLRLAFETGDDRIVTLCPHAIQVLSHQIKLRERLKAAGLIHHDHLFFAAKGMVIRHLQYAARRWRQSLSCLSDIRYRRPYNARHSSVSWNLMIGKSPLWVSKQHGHCPETMFRAYAAWTERATEPEVVLIREAMGLSDQPRPKNEECSPQRGPASWHKKGTSAPEASR